MTRGSKGRIISYKMLKKLKLINFVTDTTFIAVSQYLRPYVKIQIKWQKWIGYWTTFVSFAIYFYDLIRLSIYIDTCSLCISTIICPSYY